MKKLLLFVLTLTATTLQAKQVNADKAKDIALQLMQTATMAKANASDKTGGLNLVYTATADTAAANRAAATTNNLFYIFNQTDNGGFVIVAADDAVSPILAYSRENPFCADNMPCSVKAVLDDYRSAITAAIAEGKDASSEWTSIAKAAETLTEGDYLVKSQWNQGYPYNALTPILAEEHCATGCVATAMAQIMYYWKYPEAGHGSKEYYCYEIGKTLTSNFTKPFDWTHMRDKYDYNEALTETEIDAIGHLMLQCGISLEMGYYSESGAVSMNIGRSLVQYFHYNSNTVRFYYLDGDNALSQNEWIDKIKEEIADGRPIAYSSYRHCYICDGYAGDDYLHLNFGWSGYSDGFYKFMTGESQYLNRTSQEMICGIMPETVTPSVNPQVKIKSTNFNGSSDKTLYESGEYVYFGASVYTPNCAFTQSFIDSMAIANVNTDGEIVEILGKQKPEHKSYSSYYYYDNIVILCNEGTADVVKHFLPACLVNGEWVVVDNVSAIEKTIKPLPTGNATKMYLNFNNSTIYCGIDQKILTRLTADGSLKGILRMKVKDQSGAVVLCQDHDIAVAKDNGVKLYYQLSIARPGLYDVNLEAFDSNGNVVAIENAKTYSLKVIDEPEETYLEDFGFAADITSTTNTVDVIEGQDLSFIGTYINPTDESCTKTITLIQANDFNRSNALAEQTITIPAHSKQTFKFTFKPANSTSMTLYEFKENTGEYKLPTTNKLLNTPEHSSFFFNLITPSPTLQLTKRPSLYYEKDSLTLYAKTPCMLNIFYNKENYGIRYTAPYIRLKAQLCQGNEVKGEAEGMISEYHSYYSCITWMMDGMDVEAGEYTLKFFLCIAGYDIAAIDENGDVAEYAVTVNTPNLLPQHSKILSDDGENYLFTANTIKLERGKMCELRYNIENVHTEDFNGTIKVEESYDMPTLNSHLQSEEKPITIKGNFAERAYGTIKVTVPENYNASRMSYSLMAKSQYDDVYRVIPDGRISLEIGDPSAVENININDGVTIDNGKIILCESKRIKDVIVYAISGCSVGGYNVDNNTVEFYSLPSGIYMVKIDTEDGNTIKVKVVK